MEGARSTVCLVKDRLCLIEEDDDERDDEGELICPLRGRRIFVLSLQGDTLQVYTNPVEGQRFSDALCCFDGKLLAPVQDETGVYFGPVFGVVALRGLQSQVMYFHLPYRVYATISQITMTI